MRTIPKHIINTLSFDIVSNNSSEAMELQNRASRFGNNDLPLKLNSFLDDYSSEKGPYTYNKIEVDLGIVNPDDFPNAYMEALICQLRYKLDEVRLNEFSQDTFLNALESSESDDEIDTEEENEDILKIDVKRDFVIFREFILKGTLPWFCDPEQINLTEILKRLISNNDIQLKNFIKENIHKYIVRQRLIYQFDESEIFSLIISVFGNYLEDIKNVIQNLKNIHKHKSFIKSFDDDFNFLLLDNLLEVAGETRQNRKTSSGEQYLFLLALKTGNEYADFLFHLLDVIHEIQGKKLMDVRPFEMDVESYFNKINNNTDLKRELYRKKYNSDSSDQNTDNTTIKSEKKPLNYLWERTQKYINEEEIFRNKLFNKKNNLPDIENEESPIISTQYDNHIADDTGNNDISTIYESELIDADEAGYYISNAGLVLLHPFIPELFRRLNYIHNGEFRSETICEKAIHLLQYAICSGIKCNESILILNKIICGKNIEDPIRQTVDLTMYEKGEATRMVNAAIKHWQALKNTSVPSFKRTFLHRNGLLKLSEKRWKLFVERKAYDVLLDRIPWSYRTFKFSWMEYPIEVEW